MTTNGNGYYDLAGAELADDGLDLVQKLEGHLSIHPEDGETRGALQQLLATPVANQIRLWDWSMAPDPKPMEWLVQDWLPAGRVSMLTGEGGAGKSPAWPCSLPLALSPVATATAAGSTRP